MFKTKIYCYAFRSYAVFISKIRLTQGMQCTYNETLMWVGAATVAVLKQ